MSVLQKQEPFYDEVEWYDSDESEDEDYLPRFDQPQPQEEKESLPPSIRDYFLNKQQQLSFHQIIGSSFDSQTTLEDNDYDFFDDLLDKRSSLQKSKIIQQQQQQQQQRKLFISADTPLDKVRRAIDKTVDNGIEKVDISHIELNEMPDDIQELQYVTVVHNDVVKIASLQIFLYGNNLHSINPCLFRLKNLTVLSLRSNRLTSISPDIALLENLVELSLGNNQLKYIPAELIRLKKLNILSLFPNPFLETEEDKHRQLYQRNSSLIEIATRIILSSTNDNKMIMTKGNILPADIIDRFKSISTANHCEHCKALFHVPNVEDLVWRDILGNQHVPVLYRFCSIRCCDTFSIKNDQRQMITLPQQQSMQ